MTPYQSFKTVLFSGALFEGESAVRIISSLSPRPGSERTGSQVSDRSLGTKFDMQAPGLKEEKR